MFISHNFDSVLNNHALKGLYFGCRSINVTGDWRAVYEEVDSQTVNFVDLGTHSQLYK